jgi:glycosyltransferase involved in cell wall biosynthesis
VFWGRLDFEPNTEALAWFFTHVWNDVLREVPDARFTIIGYDPTAGVRKLAELPGVTLLPNVQDLRATVCQHALVALPIVSGGGIKNKLLEGAAMGRPIICTPRAAMDLRVGGQLPFLKVRQPSEWVKGLVLLWNDEPRRHALGRAAREWVSEYHSWATPARNALEAFRQSLVARSARRGSSGSD